MARSAGTRISIAQAPDGPVALLGDRPLTGRDARRSLAARLPREPSAQTLYLLVSPIFGYGLREWVAGLPITSLALVIELDPELLDVLRLHGGLIDRIMCRTAGSIDEALQYADRAIARCAVRRVESVRLTGGARLHADRYLALESTLALRIQRFWMNRGTEVRLHRRWTANLLTNALRPTNAPSALHRNTARAAVLLGAGPSLEIGLPILAETTAAALSSRPMIIALDTALPALAEAGVTPDLIVSMDAQAANARDFLPWRWDNVAVLADLTVHPSILRRAGPSYAYAFLSHFAASPLFIDPELRPIFAGVPLVPPRGSVAPAALRLIVEQLGVRSVVCIGIDFWYRPPISHARMTAPDRHLRKRCSRLAGPDGDSRLYRRPTRTVTLRDGRTENGDSILADQAALFREDVQSMSDALDEIWVLGTRGLPVGAAVMEPSALKEWLQSTAALLPSPETDKDASMAVQDISEPHREPALRRRAAAALLRRLRIQESRLSDGSLQPFLDAGLEFALIDLPQWPLMTRSIEWMELNRERALRAVRDYRRRLERILEEG